MKAVIHKRYGSTDNLTVGDIAPPEIKAGHVLIRVRATSVHADIWHVVEGRPYMMRAFGSGLFSPKANVPGTDLAGVVEEVGDGVTRFRVGDEVFGEVVAGMQWKNGGSFAELAVVPEAALAHKPACLSFEEAAALPTSGVIALNNLQSGAALGNGKRLLINGAGGAVGTLAVQIAKSYGAVVTAVDRAEKLLLLVQLGADYVIDYQKTDFTLADSEYDVILDVASTLSLKSCKRALGKTGKYVLIGHDHYGAIGTKWFGSLPRFFGLLAITPFSSNLPKLDFTIDYPKSLETLRKLAETGRLRPHLDRTYPLEDAAEALRYLKSGNVRGQVVLVNPA